MSAPPLANPYAPPLTAEPVQLDFRQAAVEESLRIVQANPGRDPDTLGVSLVLPADPAGPARLAYLGRMTLVRLAAGIGGLGLGAVLAAAEGRLRELGVPEAATMLVAASCSLGGITLLLCHAMLTRWAVQRCLGPRYETVRLASTLRSPLCTGVEDARTFTTMKITPEDFAFVGFDSAGRRLVLEGLHFRYVIHAADVLSASQQAGAMTTGVQIVFRVGRVIVGITLQYDSVFNELCKYTIFLGRDPLLKPVVGAFQGGAGVA
jgi:hypothetical protein